MIPKNLKMYSYFAFFAFGFYVVILSSAFPKVLSDLSINYLYGGYLFLIGTLGYVSGSALCALFAHKTGLKTIAQIGAFLLMVGALGYVFSDDFFKIALSGFVANAGTGLIEVGVGSLVGTVKKEKAANLLNHVNSYFALGALIGPFLVSFFIHWSIGWRSVYIVEVMIALVAFLFSLVMENTSPTLEKKFDFKSVFEPKIVLLNLLIMVYVGYEVGFSAWVSTFLVHARGINISSAAAIAAIFWIGMFIGRYGASYVKMEEKKWLIIVVSFSLVSVVAFMFSMNLYIAMLFVFLSGFGFASTYPTIQAILAKCAGGKIGNLMGVFVVFVGIGASISEWAVGSVSNVEGIFYGFGVVPLLIVAELLLLVFSRKSLSVKRSENA
jgi:FHS family glucose/mannose:H+ symporter-like MFS transporter